jgi:hypothetical protein
MANANTTDTRTSPTRPFVELGAHEATSNHQFSTTVRGPWELLCQVASDIETTFVPAN